MNAAIQVTFAARCIGIAQYATVNVHGGIGIGRC